MASKPYPGWWDDIEFFEPHEFDSPGKKHSGAFNMDEDFVRTLDWIRKQCGFPFVITSGYRTPEHNKKVGGGEQSMHLFGRAADIQAAGPQAHTIIKYAAMLGLTFGSGQDYTSNWEDRFVHLDNREQPTTWSYPK